MNLADESINNSMQPHEESEPVLGQSTSQPQGDQKLPSLVVTQSMSSSLKSETNHKDSEVREAETQRPDEQRQRVVTGQSNIRKLIKMKASLD